MTPARPALPSAPMRVRTVGACVLLAGLLLSGGLLSGCDRQADDREVVSFWVMGKEGEVVARLIPEFERLHPGIRVDLQRLPWTAAHEKLLTAFAGDALPDVCALGNTWIAEFALLGALTPLDERVARTPGIDPDDYFDGAWSSGIINGTVYAVPWYVETRLPFYRRDILARAGIDRPPTTWDEWRMAMAAIKREVGPERYSILLPLNEFEPLLNLGIQAEEPLLRDSGRYGNFSSPGFKRALAFYKEMFDKQWAPVVSNTQISNVWDEFGRGYYAFYISGPWNIAEFKQRLPAELSDDWMTMPLPGPDGPGASVIGGTSLVIFQEAQHKDAAWQLITFLSQPRIQLRLHALTGDLPPRRSAWQNEPLASDPYARAFRDQLERAEPTPKVPEWERIATEIRLVAEEMVNGRLSVDQAAAELDRRANEILEKRRWILDRREAEEKPDAETDGEASTSGFHEPAGTGHRSPSAVIRSAVKDQLSGNLEKFVFARHSREGGVFRAAEWQHHPWTLLSNDLTSMGSRLRALLSGINMTDREVGVAEHGLGGLQTVGDSNLGARFFLLPPGEGGAKRRMRAGESVHGELATKEIGPSFTAWLTFYRFADPHPNPSPGGRGALQLASHLFRTAVRLRGNDGAGTGFVEVSVKTIGAPP